MFSKKYLVNYSRGIGIDVPDITKKIPKPKDRIIIGNTSPKFDGEEIYVPLKDAGNRPIRFTGLIIGPAGCGKTKLLKTIYPQAYILGNGVSIISDPRLEYASAKHPPKNFSCIPSGFQPIGLPMKAYIPKYCINRFTKMPSDVHKDMIFQYGLSDLERNDISTLLDFDNKSDTTSLNAKYGVDAAWTKMEKMKKKKSSQTIDDFERAVKNLPDLMRSIDGDMSGAVHSATKKRILSKVEHLKNSDVFGEMSIDIIEDIRKGFIPILSAKYSSNHAWDKSYAAVWMRKLYNARTEAMAGIIPRIPPLWFVVDELQRVCPKGSSSGDVLINTVLREGRQQMCNFIGATQTLGREETGGIDIEIINQIDNIFLFKLYNNTDINNLCRSKGIGFYDPRRKTIESLKADKKNNLFECAWINPDGDVIKFYPYNPIVGHIFEKNF